ncbi:MAG: hypothetical protein KAJ63_10605, partial [Methyloprofundus sp.]|nr:hypothetical protein [Methyloprofundus sp.]
GGVNTYGYALQNPLKYIDWDGRFVWVVIPGVCAGGGCEAFGVGLVWAVSNIDWPDNLDKPIDPWNDTNTVTEVPSNILPPEIPDQCEVAYNQEIGRCNSNCSSSVSNIACKAKAKLKRWICQGAKKPKWPDDFDSNGGDPGYSGF